MRPSDPRKQASTSRLQVMLLGVHKAGSPEGLNHMKVQGERCYPNITPDSVLRNARKKKDSVPSLAHLRDQALHRREHTDNLPSERSDLPTRSSHEQGGEIVLCPRGCSAQMQEDPALLGLQPRCGAACGGQRQIRRSACLEHIAPGRRC